MVLYILAKIFSMYGRKKIFGCLVFEECEEKQEKGMAEVQEKSFRGDRSVQYLDFSHDLMGVCLLKHGIYTGTCLC